MSQVIIDLTKREMLIALQDAALKKYHGELPPVKTLQLQVADAGGAPLVYYEEWPVNEKLLKSKQYWDRRGVSLLFQLEDKERSTGTSTKHRWEDEVIEVLVEELARKFGDEARGYLDDKVHDVASHVGSAVNNEGLGAQVCFLLQETGSEETQRFVHEILLGKTDGDE